MKASLLHEKRSAVVERGDRKGVRQAERGKAPPWLRWGSLQRGEMGVG